MKSLRKHLQQPVWKKKGPNQILPRRNKKRGKKLNTKQLIDRVWAYIRGDNREQRSQDSLEELQVFLDHIRDELYDVSSIVDCAKDE
jgi:hypothetical protein